MKTIDEKIEAMRSKVRGNWKPRLDLIETIQAAAIVVFDCEKESFFNGERTRHVVCARWASIYLCRERTKLSHATIAKLHGGLDHAASVYAVRKIKNGAKSDITEGIAEIERILDSNL